MIVSNKQGFLMIEAVLALAVASLILTPVLMLESLIVRQFQTASLRMVNTFKAHSFMLQTHRSMPVTAREFKEEQPNLQFTLKPVKKGSFSGSAGLLAERAQIVYRQDQKQKDQTSMRLIFRPLEPAP